MNNQEQNIMQIWQYIDEVCDANEKASIENLIATDEKFSALYHEQLSIHNALQQEELEQPSLRFSKNVMEKIVSLNTKTVFAKQYLDNKIIYSIAFLFIAMLSISLIYMAKNIDFSSGTTPNSFSINSTLQSFSFDSKTLTWILLMINALLFVIFIDKFLHRKTDVEAQ